MKRPEFTVITGSLLVVFIALTTQIGIGVYKRHIGCPRAFTDCYQPGMDALFWPQTASMLALYLALLVFLLTLGKCAAGALLRLIRGAQAR